jgi:hypothetical protein
MQKLFIGFFVMLLWSTQASFAQSYTLSGIEKTDKEGMQYEVLGKVGSYYWVYKKNGLISTIAQYNEQMQLVKQNDMPYLPADMSAIEFVVKENKVFAFYQFQSKSTVYAVTAKINSDGQLIGEPKVIDTAENVRPDSHVKVFNLLQSESGQKMAIFSVNTTKSNSIKVKVLSLNSQFEVTSDATVNVNAQNKKSVLSDFAIDNNGNLFCLRNMNMPKAAPAVSLLYLSADGAEVVESAILNNTLLLDELRLKVDNKNERVVLNSFYASSKKGNVEGIFAYIWDIRTKSMIVSNANRFTDALRASVSTKRNLKDAFDAFYIDKTIVQADGSMVVVAEAAETYNNRNAFSRWDYFYGGPFYNPFMFTYWNRPFGFYPWDRFGFGYGIGFGWSPFMWNPWMNPYAGFGYTSVTYNANKVALLGLDSKGNIQWVKTIDKNQSDINVDQFIGYGTIHQSNGTTFVYYNKEKGVRQFVVNSLNANGELAKGNNIIITDKKNEWMPRSLKQIGENEAIIPYQYKNRIGFAKVQLK